MEQCMEQVLKIRVLWKYRNHTGKSATLFHLCQRGRKKQRLHIANIYRWDWARFVDDRKSTSGGAFYLGKSQVAWLSKKQTYISLSTAEAEYIATTTCCTQIMWMKQTLQDMKVSIDETISIKCDNTSAISISKNPVLHSKTKHIPIKYHLLRAQVA